MIRFKSILIISLFAPFALSACTTNEPDSQTTAPFDSIEAPSELLYQNTVVIKDVAEELESKGWSNLETIEGEPDSRNRWGVILEPTPLEEGASLYSVLGHVKGDYDDHIMGDLITDTLITVVVKIVFSNDKPEGERVEVYYVSDSGRTMDGIDLESFLNYHSKSGEILSADDKELWDYMCSY